MSGFLRSDYLYKCRRKPAFSYFFDGNLDRQPERGDAGADCIAINANIKECSQGHIPADSAKAIEMSHPHLRHSLASFI